MEDLKIWVTQKNIEVDESWVQKKEELAKETRENRTIFKIKNIS